MVTSIGHAFLEPVLGGVLLREANAACELDCGAHQLVNVGFRHG